MPYPPLVIFSKGIPLSITIALADGSQDTDKPIALYEYQPGRGTQHPKEFLTEFQGYLHKVGYAGHHSLPEEITVVGCWVHLRRKFDEAVKSLPKGKAKGSSASQGLAYCNLLCLILNRDWQRKQQKKDITSS